MVRHAPFPSVKPLRCWRGLRISWLPLAALLRSVADSERWSSAGVHQALDRWHCQDGLVRLHERKHPGRQKQPPHVWVKILTYDACV
jgi:hypothetical protein